MSAYVARVLDINNLEFHCGKALNARCWNLISRWRSNHDLREASRRKSNCRGHAYLYDLTPNRIDDSELGRR